jgi:hypothetical protein
MDVVEDRAGGARRAQLGGAGQRPFRADAGELALEDPAGAVVHELGAAVVVGVASVGDHLGAANDLVPGVVVLEGSDLAPGSIADVVGQGDEVEPGSLAEWREGVVEALPHRGVPGIRVARVDVEVARVPAGVGPRRSRVERDRLIGLVGEGVGVDQVDLDPPFDLAVLGRQLIGDRRDAQLDRPLAGGHGPGPVPDRRLVGGDGVRVGIDRCLR